MGDQPVGCNSPGAAVGRRQRVVIHIEGGDDTALLSSDQQQQPPSSGDRRRVRTGSDQPWSASSCLSRAEDLCIDLLELMHVDTLKKMLESRYYIILMATATIFSLLGDQIRLAALPKSCDWGFKVANTVVLGFMLLEILLLARTVNGYLVPIKQKTHSFHPGIAAMMNDGGNAAVNRTSLRYSVTANVNVVQQSLQRGRQWLPSFYFFVDVSCLLLMLIDPDYRTLLSNTATGSATVVSAVGATRLGSKAIRVIRVLRAAGVAHRFLLSRSKSIDNEIKKRSKAPAPIPQQRQRRKGTPGVAPTMGPESPSAASPRSHSPTAGASSQQQPKSRIAMALTQASHRKVLVGAVLLLAVAPFLTYSQPDESWAFAMSVLRAADATGSPALRHQAASLVQSTLGHVLYLEIGGQVYVNDMAMLSSRRLCEIDHYGDDASLIVQDIKHAVQANAVTSILITVVVAAIFIVLVLFIERDLRNLVLLPLAKMTDLVDRISRRPLDPIDVDTLRLDQMHGLETTLLLKTISKIGGLVKVGLGEAGADIITRNLRSSTDNDFQINLNTCGKIVDGIFVFCDIRSFTDTTECLQEEVMVFVNKVAAVLHDLITTYGGSPNKNVGDAFLLVWKLDDHRGPASTASADRALYSVLKFIYEMVLCHDYVCSFSSAASQRLFARMPDYHVNIGFGLHVGWAVEGAIGSVQKIDASYISPHVSLSEAMQDMTKDYGVTIIFSDIFYNLLSSQARYHCRQLDAVGTGGGEDTEEALGLYTYDCDTEGLRSLLQSPTAPTTPTSPKRASVLAKYALSPASEHSGSTTSISSITNNITNNKRGSGSNGAGNVTSTSDSSTTNPINDNIGISVTDTTSLSPQPSSPTSPASSAAVPGGEPRRASTRKSLGTFKATAVAAAAMGSALASSPKGESIRRSLTLTPRKRSVLLEQVAKRGHGAKPVPARPYDINVWEKDPDLQMLRRCITPAFRATWNFAMNSYLAGEWGSAKQGFETTLEMSQGKDQPSKFLLSIIDQHDGRAPKGWQGFRAGASQH